jgi:hypothetical protein
MRQKREAAERIPEPPASGEKPKLAANQSARHLSGDVNHFTPLEIIEAARLALGKIDLDPATTESANAYIEAVRIFTEKENGFAKPWRGRVFLNPPGGACDASGVCLARRKPEKGWFYADGSRAPEGAARSSAKAWWGKLVASYREGSVTSAIFVAFSIELLQTTQIGEAGQAPASLPLDFPICFPARRVAYLRHEDSGQFRRASSPPHASAIVYLPQRTKERGPADPAYVKKFAEAFAGFGAVVDPRRIS